MRLGKMDKGDFVYRFLEFSDRAQLSEILKKGKGMDERFYDSDGPLVYSKKAEFKLMLMHLEMIRRFGSDNSFKDFLQQYPEVLEREKEEAMAKKENREFTEVVVEKEGVMGEETDRLITSERESSFDDFGFDDECDIPNPKDESCLMRGVRTIFGNRFG